MSKEALGPMVEDLALRIRAQASARLRPIWLERRWACGLAAAAVAALIGALYLGLRGSTPYARRTISFPPAPKLNAALAAAQERLKANPQDIAALVEAGTLHFEQGKEHYVDAINELEEARELGALDPRIFYCLGIMYQEVGLYSFALDEYRRFLRHYPDDKEIRLLSAKLLYKQGSYREAVADYERLKFRHPGDSLIEENFGLSLWGAKEVDRAIESFNLLRGMGPEQARRAEFYLGQIFYDRGDAAASLEHLLKAEGRPASAIPGIEIDRLQAALAAAYQKLGQLTEAKNAWERVLAAVPSDAKAKVALKDVNRRLSVKKTKKG